MKNNDIIEDSVLEPTEEEESARGSAGKLKKLRDELHACHKEKDDYLAGWQRAKADLVNYKREVEMSKSETARFANEGLMRDMLLVLDSFDMAFMNKEAWESVPEGWRKGIEYIHAQFLQVLNNNDLTLIDPLGAPFDPIEHEPVETEETDEKEKNNTVTRVLQRGYKLHGKVIRPARVNIAEWRNGA